MNKGFFGSLDALLITDPSNIRYLTGFTGVSPNEREAYVLLMHGKTILFTGRLYTETARRLTRAKRLTFTEISREHPLTEALIALTNDEHISKLGFEDRHLTVAELSKLKQTLPHVKLIPTGNKIENLRMIKRADEIINIRKAAALTDECFTHVLKRIRPGVSENSLVWEIERFFREHGADNAFSPIVAFGPHTSQPHYYNAPDTQTLLQKNDIVLLDFGARVNGYCADMTRMAMTGTPKPEWITAYNAVFSANEKALSLLRDGERNGATLDAAAREVIAEANLPVYPHSLGHAAGLDIHEAPRLTVHHAETLMPYMTVTVEPGTYMEGSYGIRIEDLILIQDGAIDVLSASSKELPVL